MGYFSCNAEFAISTCDPYYFNLKKKSKPSISKPINIRDFSYSELVSATNGFSADNFLGKGSHGSVYKAFLDNGNLIAAVKMTKIPIPSGTLILSQGDNCTNSPAENEIEILSRVQNPGLVNLIGFCSDSKHRKPIVVEYMPNGSLYDLIHSRSKPPGWTRRVRFALHVAKAVHILHSSNPPVIHRDIKSSNVLIDGKFHARLGDFGLALRGHAEDVRVKCTPPAGTLGYLDPAYLAPTDLSDKSDVFSFGILLLEIISGRKAIDVNYSPPSVVDWAVPMIKNGDFAGICDRRVGFPADPCVIRRMAILASRCVRSTAEKRPTMSEVVEGLKIVGKRVNAPPPIWNNLRLRVGRLGNSGTLIGRDEFDCSEEVTGRVMKMGSRRNGKVSNAPGAEDRSGVTAMSTVDRVVRSRSVGSANEIKAGPCNQNLEGNYGRLGRRKNGAGVAVRLSKCRSMGVLQSPRVEELNHSGCVVKFESNEFDSILVKGLDEKYEKKMPEKPLLSDN